MICQEPGLVGLKHIAFDGSKVKANASPKKSMTRGELKRRIKKLLGTAKKVDEEERELFGTGSPFTIPEECADDPDLMKKMRNLYQPTTVLLNPVKDALTSPMKMPTL